MRCFLFITVEKHPKPYRKKKLPPDKQFFITIPVKPYVKRFLTLNFGDPVYFHPDKQDYTVLRECLANSRKFDKQCSNFISPYKESVTVLLSERDFYRCGWDMTRHNVIKFGVHFEMKAKVLMRSLVGIYHGLGLPLHISINKFQDKFYFDENVWPYQSIKKDFYRNGTIDNIDFESEIFRKIEKIVVTNLYTSGTVSNTFIDDYENDR